MKVIDASDSSIYDYSSYFTIIYVEPKSLTITQPDTNSAYIAGSTQDLQWDSTGSISNIKVELYKGNSLFSNIYSTTSNDGTESWTLPLSCSTDDDYRIKITDTSTSSVYDYSDYFIIYAAGQKAIKIIEPSLSSLFVAGTTRSLIWNSTGPINDVKIELFKNDFYNQTIYSSTFNDGNELWAIPLNCTKADNYKIKISDISNSSVYDFSENFTIQPPKTITIDNPDNSDLYATTSLHTITWQTTGEINFVSIELYQGNIFHTLLNPNTTNDGIEEWTVPTTCLPAQDYNIKITDLSNSSIYDFSEYFTIEILKTITILNPISYARFTPGSRCEIKWNTTGNISNVNIELYQNSDLILTIAEQHENVQNFTWLVPDNLQEGDYSVKIVDANDLDVYIFSVTFTIAFPPEPDYTLLIIILSISIPSCLGLVITFYARKKIKIKREKNSQIEEKINDYLKKRDLLMEELNYEKALSAMNECLKYIQKEGIEKNFAGMINENIQEIKITHIKSQIIDLGSKYNQIFLSEIIEKTNINDLELIKTVLNDMIKNSEIYAEYSEQNHLILFDLETNIEEIDKLIETFKKWEERGYEKKIE